MGGTRRDNARKIWGFCAFQRYRRLALVAIAVSNNLGQNGPFEVLAALSCQRITNWASKIVEKPLRRTKQAFYMPLRMPPTRLKGDNHADCDGWNWDERGPSSKSRSHLGKTTLLCGLRSKRLKGRRDRAKKKWDDFYHSQNVQVEQLKRPSE